MFDTETMLTASELEIIRRSAAMAPLSKEEAFRLIESYGVLIKQRAQIAQVLTDLPTSWAAVRQALNELQRLVE